MAIIAAFAVRWIVFMKSMLLFLLSFFLISPQSLASDTPLDEQQNSANSSVKELVVGRQYGVHNCLWRPATVGENNTTYQDIAFQFAQSIGAKVTYHYFSDRDELLFALYKGKIDMAMGYAKTQEGEPYFAYTPPIYNIRSVTWYHDSSMKNIPAQALNWGCARGSVYCEVLRSKELGNTATYHSTRLLMRALMSGEIDAIYTDVVSAEQYLSERTFGEWAGYIDYYTPLPNYPASILTSKNNLDLYQQLNNYLNDSRESLERNQRTLIDSIGGEMMLSALSLEYGHSEIRYSFEENMRPFSYRDENTGQQVGYIHDLMSMMSRKSGIRFEYVAPNGKDPVDMLRSGEIDLLPGYVTSDKDEFIYSTSFGKVNWTLVEATSKSGQGKTAVLDRSGRLVLPKTEQLFDKKPILFTDLDQLLKEMTQGEVDYAYIPSYVVDYYAYGNNSDIYRIVLAPNVKDLSIELGFTLAAKSSLLQSMVNDVLQLISANEIEMLHLKHHKVIAQYGYDKANIAVIALSIFSLFLLIVLAFQLKANRLAKSLHKADEVAQQNARRLTWLSDLLDRLPSMIAIYDQQGEIVLSNKAFKKHGMECVNFSKNHCLIKNQAQRSEGIGHLVCQCHYSHRYLRVLENEIGGMNDDGRYKMMVYDDYTTLEKQKNELKQSNEKALKAIKSRDLFLATISHELRTPIAALIGLMELMSTKVESEENIELLSNAQLSATRLRLLVNDILDISKIKANQFHLDVRNGNVYTELSSLLRTYESNAEMKNLGFFLDWKPTPYVEAALDWLRVAQVLNNLLSNAVKFTQTGEIKVAVELQQHQLVVEVSDSGCGMTDEQLSHIFTPFAQADVSITRKYGGTGLGMTIVKSIVEMMSGDLDITSDYGVGTRIRVSLPAGATSQFSTQDVKAFSLDEDVTQWLTTWQVNDTSAKEISVPRGSWNNLYPDWIFNALYRLNEHQSSPQNPECEFVGNVVVVDDDPINRLLFNKQFLKLGIKPVLLNDGLEAFEYLCQHAEEVDLVVTDCHMPNLDGYELTKKIKHHLELSHLPVVGCTAEDSKIAVEKANQAGMCHMIYKPYTMEVLSRVLKRYLVVKAPKVAQEQISVSEDFIWLEEHQDGERVEIMSVVVESFIQERELIEQREGLAQVIHRLKGSSALLQLDSLTNAAKAWEETAELHGDAETDDVLTELSRLIVLYQEWLVNNH